MSIKGSSRRYPLHVEVTIRTEPALLTACWPDGRVEVTTADGPVICNPADLVGVAPHLFGALTVMLQHVCCQNVAQQQVSEMRRSCRVSNLKEAVSARNSYSQPKTKLSQQASKQDGVAMLNIRMGAVALEGVSADGRIWVINGRRLTLGRMAHVYKTLLAQLLVAARPALTNPTEFYFAAVYARSGLAKHVDLSAYRLRRHAGRPDLQVSPGYVWVLEELNAPHPLRSSGPQAPSHGLNNRVRHVR